MIFSIAAEAITPAVAQFVPASTRCAILLPLRRLLKSLAAFNHLLGNLRKADASRVSGKSCETAVQYSLVQADDFKLSRSNDIAQR